MVHANTTDDTQFEAIKRVVKKEGLEGKELTAREIFELVKEENTEISSSHKVATILGYNSERSDIKVIEGSPYKYEFC